MTNLPYRSSPFLKRPPDPLPDSFDFGRIEGMMLGLAIGDALANPTEGRTAEDRALSCGQIADYPPDGANGDCRGYPSDDTQLAFWTLEQILEDGALDAERLMRKFANRPIIGIGKTVQAAIANYHGGRPALECGARSAANGALMRISPTVIPHLRAPSNKLWRDAIDATVVTHRDSAAIAASVAFVELLWNLLRAERLPNANEWWDPFCHRLAEIETDEQYRPRATRLNDRSYTLSEFIAEQLPSALSRGESVRDAASSWLSGAYLLETVPVALYILARHGNDPEQAIVRAVNDTWDNDTIGAIVGAAVGALHGREALPRKWIDGLSGRTHGRDDGQVFRLLAMAREAFAPRLID